ncbi:T-box protein 2-like [Babylonia areolata]|uniref:T-box protein 2-like n=1 Tax=Babylonia areolata TaxID=304850 RepID=UPI003FD4BA1D
MIINRNGRRMFPYVSVRLWGLEDLDMYEVEMEVVPADSRRYKFIQSSWTAVGVADNPIFNRPYPHPESPNSGKHWMRREIHFPRIKLTNNRESCEGNMLLHSMHKYVVQITVRQMQNIYTSKALRSHTFRLDLTSFIAVTAYQNDLVTKLKIHNNPFAKAFRDSNLPMSMKRGMATKRHYSYRGDIPLTDMDRLAMPPGKKRELQESGHRDSSVLLPETLPGMSPFYQTITQTGQSSMPLPPPSSSMMWMPHGIPPPWMANLGRGLIHPCFYSLPRPSGLGPPQHVLSSNPVVSSWDRRSPAELY